MIPLLSREQVRAVDEHAIQTLGVPGLVLMENAGRGATEVLLSELEGYSARPLIVGGPGQNGGDGWVVARQLRVRGIEPRCVLVGDEAKVRGDARTNLDALRALGQPVERLDGGDWAAFERALAHASCWVDGLFGTGLDRPVGGVYAGVIERLNAASAPGLALDLPSGVDANTGQVLGLAVRARATATFAAHKRGLHQHPGVDHAGTVRLVHIGVPPPEDAEAGLIEAADVAQACPPRALDSHKGTHGHLLVVAGSPGKTGAACLVGLGALRGGAGLVTLAAPEPARRALDEKVLELMTAPLGADGVADALALCEGKAAAVLGPGLGLDASAATLARRLAVELPVPAVLDADALTHLAGQLGRLADAAAPRVLTPHPGEAARLLGRPTAALQADRYGSARQLAEQAGQVVVLKGARTVIAAPSGALRVCDRGTPALAVAGTGDVLAGVVGAALAAGLSAFDAAATAVWCHAVAGELAARGDAGLLAHEVADALPAARLTCRT